MRNLKQSRALALLLVLSLATLDVGCANTAKGGYKLLGGYAIAVETGADITENPLTPTKVVDGIKLAKDLASPTVKLLHDNLMIYADLKAQIKGIKAAGGEPSLVLLQQLDAALLAVQEAFNKAFPEVNKLILLVEENF